MKIYQLCYNEQQEGTCNEWHATKGAAETALADAQSKYADSLSFAKIYVHEIKPTKRDFIRFLSHHTPFHDNG